MTPLPPPCPDPHPPFWPVPANACDAHCHIFGPADRFPYERERSYEPVETPLEQYQALADRLGLQRAVFVQPAVYGTDHAAMLDAIGRGGGRYRAVGIIDDSISDTALEQLDRGGIRGARFNFVGHLGSRPSRDAIERTLARVAHLGWHLVFHVDAAALLAEADWLATLPCPVVIDHMARLNAADGGEQPAFQRLLDLAASPHCWFKVSAADRTVPGYDRLDDALPFMAALATAAPDRTLWGSDWPHPNVRWMPDDGDIIDLLARAVPDEAARTAILVDNPHRLYQFEG